LQTARRLWAKILTIVTAATVSRLSHLARYSNSLTFTGRLLAIPPAQLAGKKNGRRRAAFHICQCILPRRWFCTTG